MQALLKRTGIIITLLLLGGLAVHGQTRVELEKRKQQLEKDIAYTQRILNETQKNRSATLKELQAMNSNIRSRKKLINNINYQIIVLDKKGRARGRERKVPNGKSAVDDG